jgi:hypothetical protein
MSNPTSNFGWQMPTATDLVTDLPADFEVFGQAVDTALMDLKGGTTGQVLKKNTNADMDFVWGTDTAGMTNPMTTTGDTIYSSSGSTPARLGIGSTGQILTVAGGLPTWAAAPATGANWSLLNTGGTTLTGAQTITVSGISAKDKIMIFFQSASSASVSSTIKIRLNTDTGNNYNQWGTNIAEDAGEFIVLPIEQVPNDGIKCTRNSNSGGAVSAGYCIVTGANSSGVKVFQQNGGSTFGGAGQYAYNTGGFYNSASAITSVSINSSVGNFNGGTIFVYTSE